MILDFQLMFHYWWHNWHSTYITDITWVFPENIPDTGKEGSYIALSEMLTKK